MMFNLFLPAILDITPLLKGINSYKFFISENIVKIVFLEILIILKYPP